MPQSRPPRKSHNPAGAARTGFRVAAPWAMRGRMGLTVTYLSCDRSGRAVLSGLGFAVADGAALLLRGPNGVGKSTLLRALAGLVTASGAVELDGQPLLADRDRIAETVAYCGHLDAVKPQLTVAENLAFWAALSGTPAIDTGLKGFDLCPIADRPAHVCSAGQKRRLGLARLLLAPRRLWLLDEPTTALDADAVARLLAHVRAHCAAGGIAVIATHGPLDLPAARDLVLSPPAAPHRAADPFLAGDWS